MSKTNENPYRAGTDYHIGFKAWKSKQVITRTALVATLVDLITAARAAVESVPKHMKKRYRTIDAYRSAEAIGKAASATATVILSPRAVGTTKGDPRGNASSMGHLYFAEPLKAVVGEEKRFRLRFRKEALDRLTIERPSAKKKTATKTAKAAPKTKTAPKVKQHKTVKPVVTPVEVPAEAAVEVPADAEAAIQS